MTGNGHRKSNGASKDAPATKKNAKIESRQTSTTQDAALPAKLPESADTTAETEATDKPFEFRGTKC